MYSEYEMRRSEVGKWKRFLFKNEGNEELTESNRKKKKICVIKEI